MESGIYQILNTLNNKCYIGSAVNIHGRFRLHQSALNRRVHDNRHLQRAWNKYGAGVFEFKTLLHCDVENLLFYEQRAMEAHSFSNLYNIRPTAESNLGMKWTDEARERIRGRTHSLETRKKLSKSHIGLTLPLEQREKISQALKGRKKPDGFNVGRKHSEETKRKISQSEKGKVIPEEVKQKLKVSFFKRGHSPWNKGLTGVYTQDQINHLSEINKGKVLSEETKRKISEAVSGDRNGFFGRHHSEETRRKISESNRKKRVSMS
jgi:group I intron endonuclease